MFGRAPESIMSRTSNEDLVITSAQPAGVCKPATAAGMSSQGTGLGQRWLRRHAISRDFLLMLFVVALSGNPVLGSPDAAKFLLSVSAIFLGLVVLFRKRHSGSHRGLPVLVLFGTILAVQTAHFGVFSAVTVLGLLCRIVIAYAAAVLIRDFAGTYVRVLLVLATVALIFYSSAQIGAVLGIDVAALTKPLAFPASTNTDSFTILVHTFFSLPPDSTRNAGMFWEPGAFAGYVNLALVFLCLIRGRFTKREYFVRFAVLSVCLLTTKSTVGYIAFAVIACMEAMARARPGRRSKLIGYLGAITALALFCALAANLEFLAPKIEHSVLVVTEGASGWEGDRIGAFVLDLEYIAARPLTGWGMLTETRMALNPELTQGEVFALPNGFSNFAATFGVLALVAWLVSCYQSLLLLCPGKKILAVLGVLVLVIALNGEAFLNYPLFFIFFFPSLPTRRPLLSWAARQPRRLSLAANGGYADGT
jgi:hypothetical protein